MIVKVRFNDGKEEFFGCLLAIYDVYTREDIGVAYSTLKKKRFEIYETKKCVITRHKLVAKKQKNGRSKIQRKEKE